MRPGIVAVAACCACVVSAPAFPQAADNFSCAMGVRIDSKQTPRLYAMMQKMLSDFGLSTYGVKNKYNRVRPFVVHNEATCRADQEAILRLFQRSARRRQFLRQCRRPVLGQFDGAVRIAARWRSAMLTSSSRARCCEPRMTSTISLATCSTTLPSMP
jgi:hypothetical protein